MKKIITILLLFGFSAALWGSTTGVGVDSKKVIFLQYWKFSAGEPSHEVLFYNPTDSTIQVAFRKWSPEPAKANANNAVIWETPLIQPNDYCLSSTFMQEIRPNYKGLVEVFVNGKSAGLYELNKDPKPPVTRIKSGIIITERSNSGGKLEFEIIYEQLQFRKNKNPRARMIFLKDTFYYSGFVNSANANPDNIQITDITSKNLEIATDPDFSLKLLSTGQPGELELTFHPSNRKKRILQYSIMHMAERGRGQGAAVNIPLDINFKSKKKYVSWN